MADALPGAVSAERTIIAAQRRTAATGERDIVQAYRERMINVPERERRNRNALEVIQMVQDLSVQELRQRDMERRYGKSLWGRFRRFMQGEHDVDLAPNGETRWAWWREAGRRTLATVFNGKTLLGAGALGVVGLLTGGAGFAAYGALAGSTISRGLYETWNFITGRERRAREELAQAEAERIFQLKDLAQRFQESPNTDEQQKYLTQIVEQFYEASSDALSRRKQEAKAELETILDRQNTIRRYVELAGGAAGVAGGLLLGNALATSVEGGKLAFGNVETDLRMPMHAVMQQNGVWNFIYNTGEQMAPGAVQMGADAIHAYGNAPWKIFAFAGAKALPVLGAMALYNGPASGIAERAGAEKRGTDLNRWELERVRGTVEGTKSIGPAPEINTHASVGDVFSVEQYRPGTIRNYDGMYVPWNSEWRFVRVISIEADPTRNRDKVRLAFYRSAEDIRAKGTDPNIPGRFLTTQTVDQTTYAALRQNAGLVETERIPTATERRDLAKTEIRSFFDAAVGKQITLVDKPSEEALKIRVSSAGWPMTEGLDKSKKYRIQEILYDRNQAKLQDIASGGTLFVYLLGLKGIVKAVEEGKKGDAAKKDEVVVSADDVKTAREKIRNKEGEELTKNSVWYLDGTLDGTFKGGTNSGEETTLVAGPYKVAEVDFKKGLVQLKRVAEKSAETVEVKITNFADVMRLEWRKIHEVLDAKPAKPGLVRYPDGSERHIVQVGQKYTYQYLPDDRVAVEYEVKKLDAGGGMADIEMTAAPRTKRRVPLVDLVERGEYL